MPSLDGRYEAIVVGSGPNGLAAAITLAQQGHSVLVVEAEDTIGGSTRSAELTLPGFQHDLCSAVHPMAVASPFLSSLPLAEYGLEWIFPPVPLAHPMDDGSAIIAERSVEETAANLGRSRDRYAEVLGSLVNDWQTLKPLLLGPPRLPPHPIVAARFGLLAMRSALHLARNVFGGDRAGALFAGMAAHSILPLDRLPSGAFGLVLAATAHAVGWPIARGGSQKIADALATYLRSLGGSIVTGKRVESLEDLPDSQITLCDVSPRQLLKIAGSRFPEPYRRSLDAYRYGPGVCKVDWALDGPIPWTAQACLAAGTVHVGGSLEEILKSEAAPWEGKLSESPFVLVAQPTLFDSTRAPQGKHIAWAYCHVPNDSNFDMSDRIERQISRFAPGFQDLILKRNVIVSSKLSLHNANLIGGDINGGSNELRQLFARPTRRLYRTPIKGVYLCSASTPPGGGVHGMCGHLAARTAMRDVFRETFN